MPAPEKFLPISSTINRVDFIDRDIRLPRFHFRQQLFFLLDHARRANRGDFGRAVIGVFENRHAAEHLAGREHDLPDAANHLFEPSSSAKVW